MSFEDARDARDPVPFFVALIVEPLIGEVGFAPERARRVRAMIAFVHVNQTMNRAKI